MNTHDPLTRRWLKRVSFLAVLVLVATSCGGADETGSAAGSASYCEQFAELTDDPDEPDRVFSGMIDVIDNVSENGPSEESESLAELAEALRIAEEIENGGDPDINVFQAGDFTDILSESEERLGTVFQILLDDCPGSEDGVALLGGDPLTGAAAGSVGGTNNAGSSGSTGSSGSDDSSADAGTAMDDGGPEPTPTVAPPERVDLAIAGPYGEVDFGHVAVSVDAVTISNIAPHNWLEPAPVPDQNAQHHVYVDVAMLNTDTNDSGIGPLRVARLLVDGTVPIAPTSFLGTAVGRFEPNSALFETLAFPLPDNVDPASLTADRLSLQLMNEALPSILEFDASLQVEVPYPVTAAVAGGVTFQNGVACQFPHTVEVDEVVVDIDYPIEFEARGQGNRAVAGRRWLRLSGLLTSEATEDCSSLSNFSTDFVRLVVDSFPLVSTRAPNVILNGDDSVALDMAWDIPADAASVSLVFTGAGGDVGEIVLDLPDLPAVLGE